MSDMRRAIERAVIAVAILMVVPAFAVIIWKLLTSQWLVPVVAVLLFMAFVLIRRCKIEKPLFLCLFPLVIVVQFLLGYLLEVNYCSWDVYTIVKSAREWALGLPINTFYFSQYPGNIPTMLALSGVYRFTNWAFGSTSVQFLIALNILCLDLATLAIVKLVALISDDRTGYIAGLLSFVYIPFYLFIPICYTDIYCMPFLFWGAYWGIRLVKSWTVSERLRWRNLSMVLIFTALLFVGTQAKSSGVILLLAFLTLSAFRLPIRRFALCAVLVIGLYEVMNSTFHAFVSSQHVVTREEIVRNSFPRLHNVVMGLHGNGRYCRDDVRFTQSFHSYDEKKRALAKRLFERLYDLGPSGIVKQCFQKSLDTWGAGLCFAEWYLYDGADKPVRENALHQWIGLKGRHHGDLLGIANGVRLLLLLFIIADLVLELFSKREDGMLLLHLLMAGIVTLLMFWETHPRYTLHYMLAFIAVAGCRMAWVVDLLCHICSSRRKAVEYEN